MKKQKKLIILGVILILLACAYFIVDSITEKPNTKPIPLADKIGTPDEETQLVLVDKSSIKKISYTSIGLKHSFAIENGVWVYQEEENFPVTQSAINNMATALCDIVYTRKFEDDPEITEYAALDTPFCEIGVEYADGSSASYKLGTLNEVTETYYFSCDGDPAIYMVKKLDFNAFTKSIYEISEAAALPSVLMTDMTAVEIITPESDLKVSKLEEGSGEFYSELIKWKSVENGITRPADETNALIFANNLFTVVLRNCVGYTGFESTKLEDFGLDEPSAIYRVYTNNNDVPVFGLIMGDADPEGRLYFMVEGSKFIYQCTTTFAEKIAGIDVMSFLPPSVCSIGLSELKNLTFSFDSKSYLLNADRSGEEVRYTLDGKEVADVPVMNLIIELSSMTAGSAIKDSSEITEEAYLTIDFERSTERFSNMTLKFIPYDINYYLVEFNDMRNILVTKRDVEDLIAVFKVLLG